MGGLPLLPEVDRCCFCVPDLRVASAIIAVLGIVTSPSVAWASVRHAYSIRVSCLVSTNSTRSDVVDLSLQHVLSFGFGANAGVGTSCFARHSEEEKKAILRTEIPFFRSNDDTSSIFATTIKAVGWIVLLADVVMMCASIYLLIKIFRSPGKKQATILIYAIFVCMTLTFLYGLLYLTACIKVGGNFPLLEFLFTFIDLFLWFYFICVLNSFCRSETG